ncbi:hypothetical protein chiPu_0011369 [Chiloscyllium punctatum]|uniref:Uncharacterized protein n=1 Tax=Chiloscyllium punctatum TaxID=137246 RepID=A0A401SR72_CHIPU|nr:hypothetical protein [Chiloscyllium punctatum]
MPESQRYASLSYWGNLLWVLPWSTLNSVLHKAIQSFGIERKEEDELSSRHSDLVEAGTWSWQSCDTECDRRTENGGRRRLLHSRLQARTRTPGPFIRFLVKLEQHQKSQGLRPTVKRLERVMFQKACSHASVLGRVSAIRESLITFMERKNSFLLV